MRARTRVPAGSPCRYASMAHESSRLLLFALTLGLALLFEGCGQGWSVDEQTEARGDGVLGHWTDLHGAVTGQPDDDLRARAQPNLGTQPRGDDDLALGRRLDDLHDGSLCPDVQRFASKYNAARAHQESLADVRPLGIPEASLWQIAFRGILLGGVWRSPATLAEHQATRPGKGARRAASARRSASTSSSRSRKGPSTSPVAQILARQACALSSHSTALARSARTWPSARRSIASV